MRVFWKTLMAFLILGGGLLLAVGVSLAQEETTGDNGESPESSESQSRLDALVSQRSALEANITELEAKIKEYQNDLADKRQEISSLKNEVQIINTQISKLNLEIRRTESQIQAARLSISETQETIAETTQTIFEKQEALADLLRQLNKLDGESTLERMLLYRTFSEVLNQAQYAESVQAKLTDVLKTTQRLKSTLEGQETALKKSKKSLEEKNLQLSVQKSAQQTEKSRKDNLLKVTKGEEAKYQQLLSQVEKEQAELFKELAKVEQQILIQKNFVNYFEAGTIPKPGTRIFIWPVDSPLVSQGYGFTRYARRGAYGGQGHNGIDITAGLASPIKAAAGGRVVAKSEDICQDYIRPSCNGYWGNWMAIQHPGGLVTLYSHLTKPSLKGVGEDVEAGEIIGYEGATGNVTGSHLHFSVFTEFFTYRDPKTGDLRISYNFNKTLNPLDYL